MNPLRVLIVDDEQPARERLRELLADCSAEVPNVAAGEAVNGIEAIDWLSQHAADVVLVDIHMPGMSGVEFARHAQVLPSPPAVIFVTAHDQYAVAAFEVNALDYLLKPVRVARLRDALRKASGGARMAQDALSRADPRPRKYFSVAERNRVTLVPVAEVLFLKAEQKYVTIRMREREYLIEESLAGLEQEFADILVRIHRNCLVARACIRGFERVAADDTEARWAVMLDGCAERLPVSRRQWAQVKSLAKA